MHPVDDSGVQDNVGCREKLTTFDGSELSDCGDQAIEKVDIHFQEVTLPNAHTRILLVQFRIYFQIDVSGITFSSCLHNRKHLALLFLHLEEILGVCDFLNFFGG